MIIGMTGRIAAGKETLTKFLREKNFEYFETSKILKEELEKRGLEVSRENMQNLGDELREKQGQGVLMKIFLDKIEKNENYIVDSLRNAGEIDFLRNNISDFILIGVDAPQKMRFERILKRGKTSDPKIWEEFIKVDNRDFFDPENPKGQQVGKCLELTDYKIINDSSLENFKNKINEIWEEIKEKC